MLLVTSTYRLFESSGFLNCECISFADDRNNIDFRAEALKEFDVQLFETVMMREF